MFVTKNPQDEDQANPKVVQDNSRRHLAATKQVLWKPSQASCLNLSHLLLKLRVPDFGGTAHAYCGDSLSACIGDLLEWWVRPQREAAIRGYIIKSRVRQADHLLLARPYSPHLFKQGAPLGPYYLREVLRGNLTYWHDAIQR